MASAFNPKSVIADITVEAPDFSMLAKAAMSVQNRYLEGFNQYKSTINSLLNAAISSDDNVKFRSEYFKKIDGYLNNLAGVDFSNPANVRVASSLMEPLVKDPEFLADYNNTMIQNAEKRKLEQVRMSTDEKVRAQYSPIMESAMNYASLDMKNAKRGDGSIFKAKPQRYVPFADIQGYLEDRAHKQGLEMEYDILSGSYIITNTNGEQAIPNFTQWARNQMGSNFDEQLMITGDVSIRGQVDSLMQADPSLTKEQAYQQIANTNSYDIYNNVEGYKKSITSDIAVIDKQLAELRSTYGNKIPNQYRETVEQLKNLKAEYQKELSAISKGDQSIDQKLQVAFGQFMNNPGLSLLNLNKDRLAKGWAESYAMSKSGRKIQVNQAVENEKNRQWDKYLADLKYERDIKMKYLDAQLDLEGDIARARLGIGSKKGGKGGTSTGGLFPTTASEMGQYGGYEKYLSDKNNSYDQISKNYFDRGVLEIATNSKNFQKDFGITHAEFTDAVTDVIDRWQSFGTKPEADKRYYDNYIKVFRLLNRINPNLKNIDNISTIFDVIQSGVINYKGTDAKGYQVAQQALSNGDFHFENWSNLVNQESNMMADFKRRFPEYYNFEYFDRDVYNNTGKLVLRSDLDPEDREFLSPLITPNWDVKYSKETKSSQTGFMLSGVDSDDFNFGVIDELIKNARYVTDYNNPTLDQNASNKAGAIRNKFQGAGGVLKDFFEPNNMTGNEYVIQGETYLQISIPVKRDKKGVNLVDDVTGGSMVVYVPENKAREILESYNVGEFLGKQVAIPAYGSLSELPDKLFNNARPIDWINDKINQGTRIIKFPEYFKSKYGISNGFIEIDRIAGNMSVRIVLPNGQDEDIPLGGTLGQYLSDPVRYSNAINQSIIRELEKYNSKRITSMNSQRSNHEMAVNQNPDNYFNIDELV